MSALVGVTVATQSAASASGYGPDAFINLDGSIRYVPNAIPPTNQFGWANSGVPLPTSTCTPPGVGVSGSNGLFDCGSPSSLNTASKTFVPNPPNYIGPAPFTTPQNVLAHGFQTGPSNNDWVNCASGATQGSYQFGASGFGNNKFDDGISQLTYQVGSVPPKDQLTDAYAVSRNASNHHIEVYFGEQRPDNLGDSHIDFQFLQNPISLNGDCGTTFNGQREQGDFLVEVNYTNGGTLGTPAFYLWTCPGTPTPATGTACDTTGSWVQTAVTTGPTGVLQVVTNPLPTLCGGWVCEGLTSGGLVDTNEFAEGAIDLTALANALNPPPAVQTGFSLGCASNMLVETRSSQSPTATVEAFVKPVPFSSCVPTTTVTTPSATSGPLGTTFTDGVTVTGNATFGPPTGDVTFYVCSNTTSGCNSTTGTKITPGTNPVTLTTSGTDPTKSSVATSPSFTPTAPGNYCFAGYYTPTAGNFYNPSHDTSSGECFTVSKLTPGFTTAPASNPITFGGTNTDTATVFGNSTGGVPGGTVQFSLCKESTVGTPCTGGTAVGSAVTLTPVTNTFNATATSIAATPSSAGTWCFNAAYTAATSGNYASVSVETNPSAECFAVNPQGSQTTTQVTASSVTFGSGGITDTVSVSPSSGTGTPPTGTVQFYVCKTTSTFCSPTDAGTKTDGSAVGLTVPLSGSTSTATSTTFMPTSAGTWCFAAVYSGDGNYLASQDNTTSTNTDTNECVDVTKAGTATTTTVHEANPAGSVWSGTETTGASAFDTASVAPDPTFNNAPVPTGTVTYTFFRNGTCNGTGAAAGTVTLDKTGAGSASTTEGPLGAGSYSFKATYSGDGNYLGSTGSCEPFTVNQGTSGTVTTVDDAASSAAWSGSEKTGASAFDTTTVTPSSNSIVATGTVTYTFFRNGTCNGTGTGAGTVTLDVLGGVPNSSTEGPLGAGSYSFQAVYSGDTNYAGSTGACEPFTVGQGTSGTATTVNDAATTSPWSATETTGASAYDTTTVTPSSNSIVATGTVTYTFFGNGTCNGTGTAAGTVGLTNTGAVPNSNTEGPLGAGSYSFQAAYSGDTNYAGSTGACEPFTVGQGTSGTATTVKDAVTTATWSGTETTGASAYDTTTVTPSSPIVATGTVTYTFFTNGACSGNGAAAGQVTLDSKGGVPQSNTEGPLNAGAYSFLAVYSGDTNYSGSTGTCEPFNVGAGPSATATVVNDAGTNVAWSGSETTGASAYDTTTVGPKTPFTGSPVPSGTVSYTFFRNGTCNGTGAAAGTVTLTNTGAVPQSDTEGPLGAGSYSFQAVYSGNANYTTSTGSCEPFTVGQGTSGTATTVFDAATNAAWTGAELGTPSAYDTTTVTPSSGIVATGTVTYTFFANGTCNGTGTPAGTVTLTNTGSVPNSDTEGPLSQGSYSFQAVYSGDTNYAGSTGACEPFAVKYPVINVVKSEPTPGNGVSVVAGQATITYNLDVTNTGLLGAPNLTVTDVIPAGSTYVPGSADATGGSFDSVTNTISWPLTNIPAAVDATHPGTAGPLSFQVTVNAADANGSTIVNQAAFSNVNTVKCTAGPVQGTCLTNQVSNPVIKPIVDAVKSSVPADGSTVTPGSQVVYTISLTNAGGADATETVTDAVPTGTTFGSATAGGTEASGTVTWSNVVVPANTSAADPVQVSFTVTVNLTDANGSTILNHAIFTNNNTPTCITSDGDTTATTCDTNTVTLTVIEPIINVVKAEPTPGDGQTVTAGQSAPITYSLSLTNAGSLAATDVTVTDAIPAGATYVANSANAGGTYDTTTNTVSWLVASVPAATNATTPGTAGPLTFQVTVNASDANGSTIVNQAAFTNVNTVKCTAAPVAGFCLTNQVSNPVQVITPTPATAPVVTTTTVKPKLAFTGTNAKALAILALALVGAGLALVLIGRRRNRGTI